MVTIIMLVSFNATNQEGEGSGGGFIGVI